MKPIILIFSLSFLIVFGFSCTKNYDCGCAYDRVSGSDTLPERQKFELLEQKEDYANDYCEGQQASFEQESDLINVDCVLSDKN